MIAILPVSLSFFTPFNRNNNCPSLLLGRPGAKRPASPFLYSASIAEASRFQSMPNGGVGNHEIEFITGEFVIGQRVTELHIVRITVMNKRIRHCHTHGEWVDLLAEGLHRSVAVQLLQPLLHAGEHAQAIISCVVFLGTIAKTVRVLYLRTFLCFFTDAKKRKKYTSVFGLFPPLETKNRAS